MSQSSNESRIQLAREALKRNTAYCFVSAEEFYALMVSNTVLQRMEIAAAQLTGLFNVETGITYVVESERLNTDRTW